MPHLQHLLWRRRAAALVAVVITGCSGSEPPVPEMYPPEKAAEVAMETYDANGDGQIAGAELDKCLALKFSLPRVDTSGDKAVGPDEIAERIRAIGEQSTRMSSVLQILSRQGPVAGATVTLTLEPFMGAGLPTYTVTTDDTGGGAPKLQGSEESISGIPLGFYRVTISVPGQTTEVVRGCEVADDSPTSNRLAFSMEQEAPVTSGRAGGR